AGDERFELRPGLMARVAPEQLRRIVPGAAGVRLIVLGGAPGSFQRRRGLSSAGPCRGAMGPTDERSFVELTAPHRAALHAHCYRLLGSLHDADDALQETLLRAWRGID